MTTKVEKEKSQATWNVKKKKKEIFQEIQKHKKDTEGAKRNRCQASRSIVNCLQHASVNNQYAYARLLVYKPKSTSVPDGPIGSVI